MQTKKLIIVLALCLSILPLAACAGKPKVATQPDPRETVNKIISGAKLVHSGLAVGPALIDTLVSEGVVTGEKEQFARNTLSRVQASLTSIINRAESIATLTDTDKVDLGKLIDEAIAGIDDLYNLNKDLIKKDSVRNGISLTLSGLKAVAQAVKGRLD